MRALYFLLAFAVAASFAALAVLPWTQAPADAAPERTVEGSAKPAPQFDLPAFAATDHGAILERPLFSAARRPPPPEEAGLPVLDPNADKLFGRYEIVGVVKLGAATVAMLRDEAGALLRIRAGERVKTRNGEADVLEITLESLTFQEAGDTVVAPVRKEGAETE